MQQTIVDVFTFQRGYLGMLVDDIPDDRMTEQVKGLPNHPAWQIGHLAVAIDNVCMMLLGCETAVSKEYCELFDIGSTPVADPSRYPSKRELLATLDAVRQKAADALAAASPESLAAPNPSAMLGEMLPTAAHMAAFMMLTHESSHLGQLSVWRQAAGMRPALEKFAAQTSGSN